MRHLAVGVRKDVRKSTQGKGQKQENGGGKVMARGTDAFFFCFVLLWSIKWFKAGVQKCIKFQTKPCC